MKECDKRRRNISSELQLVLNKRTKKTSERNERVLIIIIIKIIIIVIIIYLTTNGLSPGGSGYNVCT
jgi:cell division protein FtsL